MAKLNAELQSYADDGLRLCRAGDWNKGLSILAAVLEQRGPSDEVPGIVYSYLGYGVARFQGKLREGVKLCEHALKLQYYETDNHWNLARIQALAGERLNAHQSIERGLKLDPTHEGLLATQKELGVRRPPVIGFLARGNPINVFLGRLRHSMKESTSSPPAAKGAPPRSGTERPGGTRPAGAVKVPPPPRPPGARSAAAGGQTPKNP